MIHAVSSYGPAAASTRVRLLGWFDHLRTPHEVHSWAGFADNRPGRLVRNPISTLKAEWSVRRSDLSGHRVLLSREASPLSFGEVEARILRQAAHGVFDFDDAIYLDVGGPRGWTHPGRKFRLAVEAADVVIAGNDHLAERASRHHHDVRVIPSCVEPSHYVPKSSWTITGSPTIVWLGSASTEVYVTQVARALARVCRATGARLVLISSPQDNPALHEVEPYLTRVPWSLDGVGAELAAADVAIAPLDDGPYAQGKCAYKLLQYAASGLPMVGSPTGANAVALNRFDGVAVRTHDEWADALVQVLTEPTERRAHRGKTALRAVREHYSFEAWAPTWCAASGLGAQARRP